jgi:hypothetical protein
MICFRKINLEINYFKVRKIYALNNLFKINYIFPLFNQKYLILNVVLHRIVDNIAVLNISLGL